ncbi:MAG: glycosyltransferase [Bacteroidia bacterium]|nr:glycosyltransferase [Bacteroidia bacterium]
MMQQGISVVICCYNSENKLPTTLKHLSEQDFSGAWEIIVIDNGSTDSTSYVAQNVWKQLNSPTPIRVIYEPQLGLNFARHCGILNAQYEYIIFCDDDNWLAPDYLSIVYQNFQQMPDVGAMGGQSEGIFEEPPPPWLLKYIGGYAIGKQATRSGIVDQRRFIWGAGMAVRASVLKKIYNQGFHSILSDRKGNTLSAGGDGELCELIMQAGYHLYYDEKLNFKHFITKNRLSWSYVCKLYYGFGQSHWFLSLYKYVFNHRSSKRPFICDMLYLINSVNLLIRELFNFSYKEWIAFFLKPSLVYDRRIVMEMKIGKLFSILTSICSYRRSVLSIHQLRKTS